MPTVYFKTNTDLLSDSDITNNNLFKYYLELVVHEVEQCLNLNGINFIYANNQLPAAPRSKIPDDAVEIILKVGSKQGPIPCGERGVFVFFTPGDPNSKRLAVSISKNIQNIYMEPSLVKIMALQPELIPSSDAIPSVVIGICYSGNPEVLVWLSENIEELAKSIVISILEYYGIPFTQCQKSLFGVTNQDTNIMRRPTLNSEVIGSLKANTKVKIIGQWEDWYIIFYDDSLGYVQTKCITA